MYLFIRYNYPYLLLSNTEVIDDEGESCTEDINCYNSCDNGSCSNPRVRNIWLNVVVLVMFIFFILGYGYIIAKTYSSLYMILFIITVVIFYLSQRFNLDYSSYRQKLVSAEKEIIIDESDPDNPYNPNEDIIETDEFIFVQNKTILTKNIVTLILYFTFSYIFYFTVWSKNSDNYNILSNSDNIFLFTLFGFSVYLFLDMIVTTRPVSENHSWLFKIIKKLFNFDDIERENKLFDTSWIMYSIMNSANLVYIMIVGQYVFNSITGKGDTGLRYFGIISFFTIIINFYHYNSIKNIQEECLCLETSQLSISKNNLKIYQINLIILSVSIIYVALMNTLNTRTVKDLISE